MNQPRRRRMLIVDVAAPSPVEQIQEPPQPLTKQQLHMRVQKDIVDAAGRYGYEIGRSDEFEGPIWKKVDLILKATSQTEAEALAAAAEEFGILKMSVWHKKVR